MKPNSKKLDGIFDALANNHRRSIVYALSFGPATISKLANQEKLSLPAIHKHIKILEENNIVIRRKSGRCNFLALNRGPLLAIQDWVDQYNAHWGHNDESLENYIERIERESEGE